MPPPDSGEPPTFTAADDAFHFDQLSDRWWETETAWFSYHVPERRLGGWFYNMFRPNIGTVAGGAWVWDDTADLPWEVPYSVNYSALQLPPDADLRAVELPTGVGITVLEPTRSYRLTYRDAGRYVAELRFDAVMDPEPLTAVGSTFGSAHHFDQFGRVTGHIALHGERIDVDCLGMRDRTWGPRPEHRPRQAAYVTGAASAEHGFLAVTNGSVAVDPVAYGFLRRDAETCSLARGQRRVERDPERGLVTAITVEGVDSAGRELHATGRPVSRIITNRHTFIDSNSLIRWQLDGEEAWGEDQDMWPVHDYAAAARARRAAAGRTAGAVGADGPH